MKNFSLALLFFLMFAFLFPFFCVAQSDTAKREYKWGIGVQVNQVRRISQLDSYLINVSYADGSTKDKSYSFGITPYYFLKENFALRIRIDITKTNINLYKKPHPVFLSTSNVDLSQTNYEMALGCAWLLTKGIITFGGGLEIPIGVYGDFTSSGTGLNYTNGILTYSSKNNVVIPGGNSYGIGGFGNLYFNFFKNISFGFQLSTALLHYKIGGSTTEDNWVYDPNGVLIGHEFISRETTYQQFAVVAPIASFNLLVTF